MATLIHRKRRYPMTALQKLLSPKRLILISIAALIASLIWAEVHLNKQRAKSCIRDRNTVKNLYDREDGSLTIPRGLTCDDTLLAIKQADLPPYTDLILESARITPEGIRYLEQIKISLLDLTGTKGIDYEVMLALSQIDLSSLDLSKTDVLDATVTPITSMRGLTSFGASDTLLSDLSSPIIAQLEGLVDLNLSETKITDIGASALRNLKLQSLDLSETKVSDLGISQLNTSTLEQLILSDTMTSGKFLHKGWPNLADLSVDSTSFDDFAAELLVTNAPQVATLRLGSTKITGSSAYNLSRLSRLYLLDLSDTAFDDIGFGVFADRFKPNYGNHSYSQYFGLHLDLSHTKVTDFIAEKINLLNITSLALGYTVVTDKILEPVAASNIRSLDLEGTKVLGNNLSKIGNYIITLDLSHTPVTPENLCTLKASSIKNLDLNSTTTTNEAVRCILSQLSEISSLSIGATKVDSAVIDQLADSSIHSLDLSSLGLSDDEFVRLSKSTSLNSLDIAGNPFGFQTLIAYCRPNYFRLSFNATDVPVLVARDFLRRRRCALYLHIDDGDMYYIVSSPRV